jgi:hypothetical protein
MRVRRGSCSSGDRCSGGGVALVVDVAKDVEADGLTEVPCVTH